MTLERVRRRYGGQAGKEWERLESTPIARIEYLITTHTLGRYLPGAGLVLDAGCGPGRYTIDVARSWAAPMCAAPRCGAQQGYRVVMCDLLWEMLRLGRDKVSEAGVSERVYTPVAGDLAALPYADGVFDVVLCLGAPLSHLLERGPRVRAVHELARVARPGARVFLTGISRLAAYRGGVYWGLWERWDQITTPEARATGYVPGYPVWYTFAPGELEGLAKEAGLQVIDRVGCEGLAGYLPTDHLEQIEADPVRGPVWRDILLETCNEPSIVGISNHLLVVAQK
jgi:SAM-dependent methyltransferase